MVFRRLEDSLKQLRSEYLVMPSLSLTPGDVARVLNVDPPTARDVLHTLEASHFLACTHEGRFVRMLATGDGYDCGLCGQPRLHGTPLQVAAQDDTDAMWVCDDCQHKLTLGLDDGGVLGG